MPPRLLFTVCLSLFLPVLAWCGEETPSLRLEVSDRKGAAMPCRVHLFDDAGKAQKAPGLPFWRDHFVCDGRSSLKLAPGKYRYEIERGPEHARLSGEVEIKAGAPQSLRLTLERFADLQKEGWYAGDLHVHRAVEEMELLMRAEDLHVAPVITWWNARNEWAKGKKPGELLHAFDGKRFFHVMAGEDERGGGALLFFHLKEPLTFGKTAKEWPNPLVFVRLARMLDKEVWIDIEKPFWWDVPLWLSSGMMDSIGLANNHMNRSTMYATEAWGRPRDEKRFPPPKGNGQWTQEIYYHILNCGLRLPPSAGSASGVLPNPVGYNRVYVHVDGELTYAKWWAGLKAGRSFVTNGPLLTCTVSGKLPGHVFQAEAGKPVELKLEVALRSLDRVPAIEVVRDGRVVETLKVADAASFRGSVALKFEESGWFLVRAVADNPATFRFASTAPFYVEAGAKDRRISKESVQFFLDWTEERIDRLGKALTDADQRAEVLKEHEKSRAFWQDLAKRAE